LIAEQIVTLIAVAAEQLPLAGTFRSSLVPYALLNAGHILSIALLIGSVVPLDLGIIGAPGFGWTREAATALRRTAIAGFTGIVFTGLFLFAVRPVDYLHNPAFLLKIAAIGLAAANAWLYPRISLRYIQRLQAAASLAIWIIVLLAGRFIGFL
jgi:hypothetical protein